MVTYYHELSDYEFECLLYDNLTLGEVAKRHPQPPWCHYKDAIYGHIGCYSLVHRRVTGPDFCTRGEVCALYDKEWKKMSDRVETMQIGVGEVAKGGE